MWKIYGKGGVAIRSSIGALKRALNPIDAEFQIAQVEYWDREHYSTWGFSETHSILRPHILKSLEYKDEREIRVIASSDGQDKGIMFENIDWKELIQSIAISDELQFDEYTSIEAILNRYGLPSITRSTLLGHFADEERDRMHLRNNLLPHFPQTAEEIPNCLKPL